MKKVWKWVIGIVIVLVVVGVVVGGALMLRNHYANVVSYRISPQPGWQIPGNDDDQNGVSRYPGMMPYGRNDGGWHGMGMRGPGMMRFGGMSLFGGLVRGVFSLGFLALVVLGIVWLVNRLRRPAMPANAVASVAPVSGPASDAPAVEVAPAAAVRTCPKCGHAIEVDWKHCPNCGKRL
jgi:hypothetical protein